MASLLSIGNKKEGFLFLMISIDTRDDLFIELCTQWEIKYNNETCYNKETKYTTNNIF